MKKYIYGAVSVAAGLLICGCNAKPQQAKAITPPFWRVTDEETGGTVYLLGTMHAAEENVSYPDYILEAYSECGSVALELDLDNTEGLNEAAQSLLLKNGTTMRDLLSEDYGETAEFMKSKRLYSMSLDSFIPYYWASVLSVKITEECGLSTDSGCDRYFLSLAKRDGKEIIEIESFKEQYGAMAEIPMEIQLLSLSECIGDECYNSQITSMNELYSAWCSFDEEYFSELKLFDKIPNGLENECDQMIELMYNTRQRTMADIALEYLQSGEDLFLFVGAAHFYIGEDIIDILENEGYSVEPISAEINVAA